MQTLPIVLAHDIRKSKVSSVAKWTLGIVACAGLGLYGVAVLSGSCEPVAAGLIQHYVRSEIFAMVKDALMGITFS